MWDNLERLTFVRAKTWVKKEKRKIYSGVIWEKNLVRRAELKFRERFHYDKEREKWILNRLQISLNLPKSMVIAWVWNQLRQWYWIFNKFKFSVLDKNFRPDRLSKNNPVSGKEIYSEHIFGMRQELGTLIKSGKALGVRSFYSVGNICK